MYFLYLKGFHVPEKVCSPSRDHQTLRSKREISISFPFFETILEAIRIQILNRNTAFLLTLMGDVICDFNVP